MAIRYFTEFYKSSPSGDSTLFFLYIAYIKTGNIQKGINILEELARRKNPNPGIYLNLIKYYRENHLYYKVNDLINNTPPSVIKHIDRNLPLTKRLFTELLIGACTTNPVSEPLVFALKKGFIKPSPDGKFYGDDTIKFNYLIPALDDLIPTVNPANHIPLKNITRDSYLYLPIQRLIALGIIAPDEDINPEDYVPVSFALRAINIIREKEFIR
uniref:Tetratricopeptide repeat protein n=1 Tax=candidate division WOR-3 bacterium TaxID=2052148 RepID=A0A7V3VUV0_UNCW3